MDETMYVEYSVDLQSNYTVQLEGSWAVYSKKMARKVSQQHEHYQIGLFFSCIYIIFLFPVGFIGNILILVVNLGHRGRLSAPDLYFVNLAVADLLLVADSLIEVFNLKEGYYDMAALCTFMNLFQQMNMYSSIFFLTWMSFDRFVALTSSTGRRMPRARVSCCLIWTCSSLLTALPFALAQFQHAGELHFCFANVSQIQWLEVTLGFVVPLCVLVACYWRIARVLQRAHRGHGGIQCQPRRQKALRMISAAVMVFFLCWLPENVFISTHLLRGEGGSALWHDYPLTSHIVTLAAFSNSCFNPLIYSFLGETFQVKLRLLFLRRHTSQSKKSTGPSTSSKTCKRTYNSPRLLKTSYCLSQITIYPLNPHTSQL